MLQDALVSSDTEGASTIRKATMAFPGAWWSDPNPQHAFWLSWISLICTAISGVGGITGYTMSGSPLILAYGLENCVDFLSSVVVLWRFYCPSGLSEEKLASLRKREERASAAISVIIGILGICVASAAIYGVTEGKEDPSFLDLLFGVSFASILVFGALTLMKFKYAKDLNSPSLYKDGICSFIGTFLSGALFFTTSFIKHEPDMWYIDPVISILVGLLAMYIGFSDVVKMILNGIPLYSCGWWLGSRRSGGGETSQEIPPMLGAVDGLSEKPSGNDETNEENSSPAAANMEKEEENDREIV